MTVSKPSQILQLLSKYGRTADVKLLALLGPETALYVTSHGYKTGNEAKLSSAVGFGFFCDSLERARSGVLVNNARAYAEFLLRAIDVDDIPPFVYLFLAAIETSIVKICQDIINYWNASDEEIAAQTKYFEQSIAQKKWCDLYRMELKKLQTMPLCRLAEFVLGRATFSGVAIKGSLLASEVFSRNISAQQLDVCCRAATSSVIAIGTKISFSPNVVKAIAIDSTQVDTNADVVVCLTDETREKAQKMCDKEAFTCSKWFMKIEKERAAIVDMFEAGRGNIESFIHQERARCVRVLTPDEEAAWRGKVKESYDEQMAKAAKIIANRKALEEDPDADIDDKVY